MLDSTEFTMGIIATLTAITVISGILLGGFVAICWRIRRTDKRGTLRPETVTSQRHHMLAFASRWDDDTSAFV
jgi:hypothetical protein